MRATTKHLSRCHLTCTMFANSLTSLAQSYLVPFLNDSQKLMSEGLAKYTAAWMNIPGVTGTGEGQNKGKPAILIFVDSLTDSLKYQLPRM
jgi:hypothetical protein